MIFTLYAFCFCRIPRSDCCQFGCFLPGRWTTSWATLAPTPTFPAWWRPCFFPRSRLGGTKFMYLAEYPSLAVDGGPDAVRLKMADQKPQRGNCCEMEAIAPERSARERGQEMLHWLNASREKICQLQKSWNAVAWCC